MMAGPPDKQGAGRREADGAAVDVERGILVSSAPVLCRPAASIARQSEPR